MKEATLSNQIETIKEENDTKNKSFKNRIVEEKKEHIFFENKFHNFHFMESQP